MKKSEEATAETESQSLGRFRNVFQSCIVKLQFFQSHFQVVIIFAFDRVQSAEYHRERLAVAWKAFLGSIFLCSDRIADFAVLHVFDACCHITYRAAGKHVTGLWKWREISYFSHCIDFSGSHHADIHARTDFSIFDTHIGDGAFIGIKNRIENQTS